ncbi:hypothetical protein CROQUDRAFT_50580 [Cronartium quercuum f. sp. fusiforme G11]|uniref:Glycosyltransferase family 25 protein n=1 Tax=Cronartium quercuum f. sp. fusiforme G11 TaxID=708437 RepID=A0A9P6NEH6_9BASI|nr:hypothetical protein CROQUDRAFT_50580 [Cronartium quercuum f. sp. fusiforme G11]
MNLQLNSTTQSHHQQSHLHLPRPRLKNLKRAYPALLSLPILYFLYQSHLFRLPIPSIFWTVHTPTLLSTSYRHQLEQATSPDFIRNHSQTLSFDHIYVLSLPTSHHRRERILKLARALELSITFVDALDKHSGIIRWIASQVEHIRSRKRPLLAKLLGKPLTQVGGMKVGSDWLIRDRHTVLGNELRLPSLDIDWVQQLYLQDSDPTSLDAPHSDISARLHDPLEPIPARQLSEGALSVWYGHTKVIRQMLENGDQSALVLEDDVDLEWDIATLWASALRRLPKQPGSEWEMVYLGHCWGRESSNPQYGHPNLHRSSEPRCLHAYALSKFGAQKTLGYLSDPWTAFQTAIDIAMPTLIRSGALTQSFSIEPAWVVQAKGEFGSDVQRNGKGSAWAGFLIDSAWDRIKRAEGKLEDEQEWVEPNGVKLDPATVYREPLVESDHVDSH